MPKIQLKAILIVSKWDKIYDPPSLTNIHQKDELLKKNDYIFLATIQAHSRYPVKV